jgi:uncharacterized membrane protein YesL
VRIQKEAFLQDHADFFEQVDHWGTFILANLLWAIFSIPLITLPATTAALFAVMARKSRGESVEVFQMFFSAMKQYWRKAYVLVLLDALIGSVIVANLYIFSLMNHSDVFVYLSRGVTLCVAIITLLANLYAWSLLVTTDLNMYELIRSAVKLALAYPLWSCTVLIAALIPIGCSLLLPQFVFALFTASAVAFVVTWGTGRVICQYLPVLA